MSIHINSITTLNAHGVSCCCDIVGISKSEAKKLFKKCPFMQKEWMVIKSNFLSCAKDEKRKMHYKKI